MLECEERTQELVRAIGEERDSHPPEVVAYAVRELTRMLGGGREQARRNVTMRGVFAVVFGLALVASALIILLSRGISFLRDEAAISGLAEKLTLCIELAVMALLGLGFVAVGLAILIGKKWALRRPFVRADDLAALAAEPAVEDLLTRMGSDRCLHSFEDIAAAERELGERLRRAREKTATRLKTWGTVAIGFGAYAALSIVVAGIALVAGVLRGGPSPFPLGADLPGLVHFALMCSMAALNTLFGIVLLIGGLGLRKRKEWARRTVVRAVWGYFVGGIAVMPLMVIWMMLVGGPGWFALVAFPLCLVQCAAILWRITKALGRPEVREACGGRVPPLTEVADSISPEGRRRRARRIRRWALAVALSVLTLALGLSASFMVGARRAKLAEEAVRLASEGEVERLEQLLQDHRGIANARFEGITLLHWMTATGREEAVRILLSHGADPNAVEELGETPLHWAVGGGDAGIAELLLSSHADVNAVAEWAGTPLHRAVREGNTGLAELLLAYGAQINAPDGGGRSPLHKARRREIVEFLLERDADLHAHTKYGRTPLHVAAAEDRRDVAEVLIRHGADVNAEDAYGWTPLHRAVLLHTYEQYYYADSPQEIVTIRGHRDMAELLLANGADVDAQDEDGRTVLHGVASAGSADWVKVLLDNGADPQARDATGLTPLDLAQAEGHADVVELLKRHGEQE